MPAEKKERQLKPMLAATAEAVPGQAPTNIRYPILLSPKFDGIRALKVTDNQLLSRKLISIPNLFTQKVFESVPKGTDGELIVGDPTDEPYPRTESGVMRIKGEPDVRYFAFDNFLQAALPYNTRALALQAEAIRSHERVVVVPQILVSDPTMLLGLEQDYVERGYEGVMLRDPQGPYKYGRSTVNQGWLLKLKRFLDAEAIVTGTYERMHNANEATTDNLGHTERSSKKEGMEPTGLLGGFYVKGTNGDFAGVDFKVSTSTIPLIHLPEMWRRRRSYEGRLLTYKYFPTGTVERPRHPVFKGWRNPLDV